jgi:hypothetical protein
MKTKQEFLKFIDSQRQTINETPDSKGIKSTLKKATRPRADSPEERVGVINLTSTPITLNNSPKTGIVQASPNQVKQVSSKEGSRGAIVLSGSVDRSGEDIITFDQNRAYDTRNNLQNNQIYTESMFANANPVANGSDFSKTNQNLDISILNERETSGGPPVDPKADAQIITIKDEGAKTDTVNDSKKERAGPVQNLTAAATPYISKANTLYLNDQFQSSQASPKKQQSNEYNSKATTLVMAPSGENSATARRRQRGLSSEYQRRVIAQSYRDEGGYSGNSPDKSWQKSRLSLRSREYSQQHIQDSRLGNDSPVKLNSQGLKPVYDENKIKQLSDSDKLKIVKQIYPNISQKSLELIEQYQSQS